MRKHLMLFVCALAAVTLPISARTPRPVATHAKDGSVNDFDYLLGDWAFVANNKQYGKTNGRWSAVRMATGQIFDEYRLVDDKGGTIYVTATIRNFNSKAGRWELIGMDGSNGLQDFGTGERVGTEMHLEQRFGVAGGKPTTLRIRYYNIQPNSFSWTADQWTDGGKTWIKDYQQIEAKRLGPSRSLPPLAGTK
jgi:hypothetical protein